jgi:acetyl-CoA acetyltransferase
MDQWGTSAIVGIGETVPVRTSAHSEAQLAWQASRSAIADAGLRPDDIDALVPVSAGVHPDELAAALGIGEYRFAASRSTAGGGSVGGMELAHLAIASGLATTVLVYFAYRGSRPGGPYGVHALDPVKSAIEMPVGWYGQPVYFASMASRYGHLHGLDDEALGGVAGAARQWAATTDTALQQTPLDLDAYRASPMIAAPLRRPDCSLITDGAGAYVVTGLRRARDAPHPPVVVAGAGLGSLPATTLTSYFTQYPELPRTPARCSGPLVFERAGLKPADIDVVEVYDCFSISTILQLEDLGFCEPGEGAVLAASGALAPGGSRPVNTGGGHLAHSFLPGMTHVLEGVRQMRRDRGVGQVPDAETCLVGGLGIPDHAAAILTADR